MPDADTSTGTWQVWVSYTTDSSTTISSDSTWAVWTSGTSGSYGGTITINSPNSYSPPPETEAERAAREERARLAKAEREAAEQRAEELLLSLLDEGQRRELQEHNSFTVFSELQRRYRIRRGRSLNVDELDDTGKVVAKLCAHPAPAVPNADTMAAQLLMLTANEAEFLRIANRSPVRQ